MNYDKILPQLYVGSHPRILEDIDHLRQECGITAVLSLQTDDDMRWCDIDWETLEGHYDTRGVKFVRVRVRDFDPKDLCEKLPECVQALDGLLKEGHKVYLHCTAGAGRSPTVAIAYLHRCQGLGLEEAVTHVKERRSCSPVVEAIRLADWDETAEGGPEPGRERGRSDP